MGTAAKYALREVKSECFVEENLPDALSAVAMWLRENPDVSVLTLSISVDEDTETIAVYYEGTGE